MFEVKKYAVLVMIPAYNAAPYIPELINRLRVYVADEDILFINDGSTDNTLELLKDNRVNYISFPENRGKGAALMAGFEFAIKNNYDSVLTIDADLQHLPEEIPRFYALDDGRHLIIGTRSFSLKEIPYSRWLSNNLTSLIVSVFSTQRVRDSQSGFRLIPVELLKTIRLNSVKYDFESEILFKAGAMGYPVVEVPISTVYDNATSYINHFLDTTRFIRQIWKRIWM
ncbi:MAG: glycosyltransferase family 2 protein [FCB group bacterium]|nr:glycosyltransferase family 2 protein [FCB group bacterium]